MMRFTLPTGRKVEMQGLHILPTRYGATASVNSREHQGSVLAGIVRQLYPESGVPPTIVWPVHDSIPQVTCIAPFTSGPLGFPEAEGYSYLVACWFVHYVEKPVANIVCEGLSRLDWERNARDFPWW